MTPIHHHIADLHLLVIQAEERAREALAVSARLKTECAPAHRFDHVISDLHAAIHGDICDALDRIEPMLGTRLFQALHGDVELTEALR
jgi:hypothetical protein